MTHKIVVSAGSRTWTVRDTDTPDYGLTDGLTITRRMADSDLSPSQPEPAVARFGIIATTIGDLIPGLDVGDPVTIAVYMPATAATPVERYAGRISDLVATPHRRGVLLDVTCVDHLADLAEISPYDQGGIPAYFHTRSRLNSLFTNKLRDLPPFLDLDNGNAISSDADGPSTYVATGAFPACVETYLAQWPAEWGGASYAGRYVIMPQLDSIAGDLDDDEPFVFMPILLPAHQAYRGSHTIAAAHVDIAGSFTRTKQDAVTAIDVSYLLDGEADAVSAGSGAVRTSLTTLLAHEEDADAAATTFLPASDSDWRVDSFTWRLQEEPDGTYLPNPVPEVPGSYLGGLVKITGIDARWSPVGTTYLGVLGGYTLTVAKARPTITLELRDALT